MPDATPTAILLQDYTPPDYLVDTVDLRFELAAEQTVVTAQLALRRRPGLTSAPPLVLCGRQLQLRTLALDGVPLPPEAYRQDAETLTIPDVPPCFTLASTVAIDPAANSSLEGLYLSSGILCTQCEAQGFRKITYYPDRPDVLARFTTTLVADRERFPVLLANGNLVESGPLDDGRHFARWVDPFPKPCYLFAAVAGDLVRIADTFVTASGREVALEIYVEARNRAKCGHAMAALQRAMRWDEETFGLEYDLDRYMILAVDDFNFGAMENKGLNVFNSKYVLASPETATDADYQAIEEVVGHEYFHNWTGNRVTCRDWFQLSLKEGLTVYRDQEFAAAMTSRPVKRIADVRLLRTSQFPEDAGPMAHPVRPESYVEINNFYTATVYNKGAEVIRMYRTLFGADGFRRGLRLYLARHDGQAATTDDFLAAMAEANDADLVQFRRWYSQAGTPRLQVAQAYDAATQSWTLTVSQSCPPTPGQPEKAPLHIPFAVGLLDAAGNDLPLRLEGEGPAAPGTRVLELRRARETFRFLDLAAPPVPSLLRDFSAPVQLENDQSNAELSFLLAHDSDPFNRWDAGQRLASRLLLADAAPPAATEVFVAAFARTLGDEELDPAFRALALTLPAELYLAELQDPIDPAALHAAREELRRTLAVRLRGSLLATYQRCQENGPYRSDAAACGRRSLKNLCLAYLLAPAPGAALALGLEQYRAGRNMTDTLAALTALLQQEDAAADTALDDFYRRWQHEPLVVDKWFTLQASARRPGTTARVAALLSHPAFNRRNPNRVRALLGAFAHGNPAAFHDADGCGYRLVAEQVLELDRLNPQVAARLASAFSRWRRYRAPLAELLRAELERLAAAPLSRDLYEVVSKSLA